MRIKVIDDSWVNDRSLSLCKISFSVTEAGVCRPVNQLNRLIIMKHSKLILLLNITLVLRMLHSIQLYLYGTSGLKGYHCCFTFVMWHTIKNTDYYEDQAKLVYFTFWYVKKNTSKVNLIVGLRRTLILIIDESDPASTGRKTYSLCTSMHYITIIRLQLEVFQVCAN